MSKTTVNLTSLRHDLQRISDPARARHALRFFKTGPGQYGEGDLFLGPSVPECRRLSRKYHDLTLVETSTLLHSKFHEERLIALLILVYSYKHASPTDQKKIFRLYLRSTSHINSWDLVDLSAHHIIGAYLVDKPRQPLFTLAKSDSLWERRISIISTYRFILSGESETTFRIAEQLLTDPHDLIHKAVGWMIREVGKRISREKEEHFLRQHYLRMPRTMLRYAIEHFPEILRQKYLTSAI